MDDGICYPCYEGCFKCGSAKHDDCSECHSSGYYYEVGECKECYVRCKKCSGSEYDQCLSCVDGYKQKDEA